MTLAPRSVFTQLAWTIALVLLGAGALAVLLGREFATRPATDQLLRSIDAFATTVEQLDRTQPPARTLQLLRQDGLEVRRDPPPVEPQRFALVLRMVQRRMSATLGQKREIRFGRDPSGAVLWMRLDTMQPLWVAFTYEEARSGTRRFSVLLLSGCVLLVWLAAAYFARRLVQPLRALAQAAPGIVHGEALPLRVDGPREVAELAAALAQCGRDVRAAAEERALMLAGISHDLRTPLTRLQFALELLPDTDPALRAGMVRDIEEVDAILSQFIAYARDGRDEASEALDLAAICRNAVAASSVAWTVEAPHAAPLRGRPMALLRAVENLVVNAQKHGGAPYALRLSQADDAWRIEVADGGAGLDAETIERVRQPFVRDAVHSGAAGSGLGLAIVERVARQHGGELQLSANAPHGLRAVLLLRGA